MRKLTIILFILYYFYAVVRYHLGKDISWNEWYFVLNKTIAWMGFTFIGLSILQQKLLDRFNLNRRSLGIVGFLFAAIHAISALVLFNKTHYSKLYSGNDINTLGWFAIDIGSLAIVLFTFPLIEALKKMPKESKVFKLGKIGFFVVLFHPLLIGFSGWYTPNTWPYYLPPITLLAFMMGIVMFGIRSLRK